MPSGQLRYISQEEAQKIDEELMSAEGAFALEQLMELAGLACAQTLAECFPLGADQGKRVMVVCGPGNQGGDGLVAARHLALWGYEVSVYMPKVCAVHASWRIAILISQPGKKPLYQALTRQCENMRIPFLESVESFEEQVAKVDVVMDAVFGFSFAPPLRAPFDRVLAALARTSAPLVAVDIPSGWDVERGPPEALPAASAGSGGEDDKGKTGDVEALWPVVLVSLTAPKKGVGAFVKACRENDGKTRRRHFLGGRFVPPGLAEKYKLNIPRYPGYQQIVEITGME